VLKTRKGKDSVAEQGVSATALLPRGSPAERRKRRIRRILIRSMVTLFAVVAIAALGLYAVANHLESNIRRIPVALAAAPSTTSA
jgi:hypothetical protein